MEYEALGKRGVALNSLDALKKTHARHIDLLARLIKIYGEVDDGICMQEGYV